MSTGYFTLEMFVQMFTSSLRNFLYGLSLCSFLHIENYVRSIHAKLSLPHTTRKSSMRDYQNARRSQDTELLHAVQGLRSDWTRLA